MEIMGLLLLSKVLSRICSIGRRKRKGKRREGETGYGDLLQVTYQACLGDTRDHHFIMTQNKSFFSQKVYQENKL